ncbi:MAG: transcription elongation factor GreA [Lachnospiraceae bacterium]|nr:transcription elongation factor GreA [Lachnospiraceae bacterium]
MGERLTKSDVEKIQKEIEYRQLVERPKILEALKEAKAQGDLSENFEYHAAKRDRAKNDGRINYLERMLKFATIIDDDTASDEVGINSIVTLYIPEDDCEETYKLVTSIRSDSMKNMVSIESPLGQAIRGKKVGDTVTIKVSDDYSYDAEVRKIETNVGDDNDEIRSY